MVGEKSQKVVCGVGLLAVVLVLALSTRTYGVVSYAVDDGIAENSIGLSSGGDVWWANRFTTVSGGELITSVQIAFHETSISIGQGFTVYLYDDLDNDGSPATGLSLLTSAPSTVVSLGNVFQTIAITPMQVSGDFYVAALITHGGGEYPAAIDETASQGRSWIAGAGAGIINPLDIVGTAALSLGVIDSYGYAGNWLLRATGEPINGPVDPVATPEPVSAMLAGLALGGLGLAVSRRRRTA